MKNFKLLLELAAKTGMYGSYTFTTASLAKKADSTQQSVSRKLIDLEKKGYISRNAGNSGIRISLAAPARQLLENLKKRLDRILSAADSISGRIVKGLGEGKYYTRSYKSSIRKTLNMDPYEGTLNVKVDPIKLKSFLSQIKPIVIPGFQLKTRRFGDVMCYKAKVNNQSCYIIRPERTTHPESVCEILAESDLSQFFCIKPGNAVKITK